MANVSWWLLLGDLCLRRVDVEDDLEHSRVDDSSAWWPTEGLWPVCNVRSSTSVEKRRVVIVGVGGGENGGRKVIVEEDDGVGTRDTGCNVGLEPCFLTWSCALPLSTTGTGRISSSSSPIQHRASATKTTSSQAPAASSRGSRLLRPISDCRKSSSTTPIKTLMAWICLFSSSWSIAWAIGIETWVMDSIIVIKRDGVRSTGDVSTRGRSIAWRRAFSYAVRTITSNGDREQYIIQNAATNCYADLKGEVVSSLISYSWPGKTKRIGKGIIASSNPLTRWKIQVASRSMYRVRPAQVDIMRNPFILGFLDLRPHVATILDYPCWLQRGWSRSLLA